MNKKVVLKKMTSRVNRFALAYGQLVTVTSDMVEKMLNQCSNGIEVCSSGQHPVQIKSTTLVTSETWFLFVELSGNDSQLFPCRAG